MSTTRSVWVNLGIESDQPPGTIRSVEELDVVIWWYEDAHPHVVDARCPHQWSHFEAAGVVDGCELVCTSHFWRFGIDGSGSKLAAHGRRDEKAPVEVLTCESRGTELWACVPDTRLERHLGA